MLPFSARWQTCLPDHSVLARNLGEVLDGGLRGRAEIIRTLILQHKSDQDVNFPCGSEQIKQIHGEIKGRLTKLHGSPPQVVQE